MEPKYILTPEEIQTILLQAEYYSRFEELEILTFGSNSWIDIICLTPINKLIIIEGNDEIGFTHVRLRHLDYFQNTSLREKAFRDSGKIDTPSHFPQGTIPIGACRFISDHLYSNGEKGNKNGCDSYTGLYKSEDGTETEYRLILIENTKIVVSLYPTKLVGNIKKPKDFRWHRATVKGSNYVDNGKRIIQIWVPYYNKDEKIEYSIFVKYLVEEKREQVFITVHNERGIPERHVNNQNNSPIIMERTFQDLPPLEIMESMFQYGEMDGLEKLILDDYKRSQQVRK